MMNMSDHYTAMECRVDREERDLLGVLMRSPEWISKVNLKPGHWGHALHRELWLVLVEMDRRRFDIDCYTVGRMLDRRPLGLDPFMPWMLKAYEDGWGGWDRRLVEGLAKSVRNAGKRRYAVKLLQRGLDEVIGMTEFPPGVTPRQWVVQRLGGHDGYQAEQQGGRRVRAAGAGAEGGNKAGAASGRVQVQAGGQVRG